MSIGQPYQNFRTFDREGIDVIDAECALVADESTAQEHVALALISCFTLLKDRSQSHVNACPLVREILKAQDLHGGLIVRDSLFLVLSAVSYLVSTICI